MDSYELFVSNDSTKLSSNRPHDFVVQLNKSLELNENSSIEVLAWAYSSPSKVLRTTCYIFCDMAENSFFHGSEQPVIGIILPSRKNYERCSMENPSKYKTITGKINRFRVYVRNDQLSDSKFNLSNLQLSLRFNNVRVIN